MATVFFSYSHKDEALRDQLETQLAMLKHQGAITTWHDRGIGAGEEFDKVIDGHVNADDIILLLVSPDFLASKYCYEREMSRAMERHEAGEAIVIPVILRPCDWQQAPFGKLQVAPKDGRPVTQWTDRDQAFLEVAKAIRGAAARLNPASIAPVKELRQSAAAEARSRTTEPLSIRSSNLRVAKHFTERDKDAFQQEAFEYLAKFFENSLAELSDRNAGIEGNFRGSMQTALRRWFTAMGRLSHAARFLWGEVPIAGVSHTPTAIPVATTPITNAYLSRPMINRCSFAVWECKVLPPAEGRKGSFPWKGVLNFIGGSSLSRFSVGSHSGKHLAASWSAPVKAKQAERARKHPRRRRVLCSHVLWATQFPQ